MQTKKRGSVENKFGGSDAKWEPESRCCMQPVTTTGPQQREVKSRVDMQGTGQQTTCASPTLNPRVSQPCLFYASTASNKAQELQDCVGCVQRRHAPQSCPDSTSHSPLTGVSGCRVHVQSCPCLAIRGPRAVSKLRLRFWQRHHLAPVTPSYRASQCPSMPAHQNPWSRAQCQVSSSASQDNVRHPSLCHRSSLALRHSREWKPSYRPVCWPRIHLLFVQYITYAKSISSRQG